MNPFSKIHQYLKRITILSLTLLFVAGPALVYAMDWPQQIEASEGTIVVYQPQPEQLTGNILTGRAAMSLELKSENSPVFGAFWFTARLDTDTDAGTAMIRDVEVTRVSWPDSTEKGEARFTAVVENTIPNNGFEISLEQLSASLKTADIEQKSLDNIKNDAPEIIFSQELAVLLSFDGKPRFTDVENSGYERALNAPFVVVRDKQKNEFYLSSGNFWYTSAKATGPWVSTQSPPEDLVMMLPKPDAEQAVPPKPPKIVVATSPTELISSDGKPNWKSLAGGKLLYVENTETPWLREVEAGQMYVLLSGRWFKSASEKGPWEFVRADKLPASFKDIPPNSDIGGLRVSVAGTKEADEATLDSQIPQTTAVKRSEAKLEVTYDGAPKFEKISGTNVSYAVNTGAQVLLIDKQYYAVDNGVWFSAKKATGPWELADQIPKDEISKIPPSSPVYNTTYVNVYESTPEVVYVGYTPGYLGSYSYYGVPVYGTGWYYPPYWGRFYYPRPPTWGLHVGYNPWTGWNYGVSWSNGFFSFGVSWGGGWSGSYRPWGCCGGWYGGGYHRPPVIINTGNINIGNTINSGNRNTLKNTIGKQNNFGTKTNNIYQRPENRKRNADIGTAKSSLKQARSVKRDNNVFADKNGNVSRRVGDDWQQRDKGEWKTEAKEVSKRIPDANNANLKQNTKKLQQKPAQLPAERPAIKPMENTRPQMDRQELNRSLQARQRGAMRAQQRPMRHAR